MYHIDYQVTMRSAYLTAQCSAGVPIILRRPRNQVVQRSRPAHSEVGWLGWLGPILLIK